jgi:hypothetical protein
LTSNGRLEKRTLSAAPALSRSGQNRPPAPQQKALLFDHLVGAGGQPGRHVKAKRLGGFQVDDELEPGGLIDR